MTKDKAVAPCEHNHGTNFNWETKAVYDNGQMVCWDCNQIYTPEQLPQTYGLLVNERAQLLAEVAELHAEALKGICVYCGYIEQYESLEQKASEEGNAMRAA